MDPQSQQPQPVQPPAPTYPPEQVSGNVQEVTPAQPSSPVAEYATPTPVASPLQSVALPQPVTANPTQQLPQATEQATPSDFKKVKILGYSLLITGLLSVVLGVVSSYMTGAGLSFDFTYLAGAFQALIGVGLLKHSKIAMYAFNVFAVLALLGALMVIGFSMLFFAAFSGGAGASFASGYILLILIFYGIVISWIVWGLYILHPKRVRRIFHF